MPGPKKKNKRISSDNYATHPALAAWCVDHAMGQHSGRDLIRVVRDKGEEPSEFLFLEPACGDTAPFARRASQYTYNAHGLELREIDIKELCALDHGISIHVKHKVDFLDLPEEVAAKFSGKVDVVATNPPYAFAEQFIRRSLEMIKPDGVAVFLLRLGFLSSLRRRALYRERPPAVVTVLQKRPSFAFGGTDQQEYAIFTWYGEGADHRFRVANGADTILCWLDNSAFMKKNRSS